MSESQAVTVAIVAPFLVVTVAPDDRPYTIRKDCPSGAAAEVSHNRPVRMSESEALTIAVVTPFLVGTVIKNDKRHTIRKD